MNLSAGISSRNRLSHYKNIAFIITVLSLPSCANMSERQRIHGEATGIGAGLGILGGAVACQDNRAACAAGGGVLGGALGYGIGSWQANDIGQRDRKNVHRENVTSGLQQQNTVMAKYNDRLKRTIDQYQRDINRNIDRRRSVGEELRKAQNAYNGLLSVLARERQAAARIPSPNQRMAYENQLRQLEGEIQKLDGSIRRLQSIGYGRVGY